MSAARFWTAFFLGIVLGCALGWSLAVAITRTHRHARRRWVRREIAAAACLRRPDLLAVEGPGPRRSAWRRLLDRLGEPDPLDRLGPR